MRDPCVRRLLIAHFLSVIGEWAVTVGVLVHAFSWGGTRAVGVISIALLVPPFACAPLVGAAMARWRTQAVRVAAIAVQAVAYGAAAISAALGAPTPVVAPFVVIGLAVMTTIHPTSAALLPRIARSTDDLVNANLWVAHSNSASALVGSLAAAVVLGLGGPEAVFAAGSLWAAIALSATLWRPAPLLRTTWGGGATQPQRVIRRALAELREHPWSRGVLCVASARNLIVGAFDVLLVILALDALDLGDSGTGYLSALVGAGSLVSTLVTTVVVRRARLRGALMAAIAAAATLSIVLGLRIERPVVFIALPLMGLSMALMDALSRTLLQRSTDPRNLGPLFAALGLVVGLGQIAGSVLAQVMLAVGDVKAALVALGAVLVALAAISVTSLRRADANAEVPVVEMALLARLPMLSSLPSVALEQVARSADTIGVDAGQPVVVEGELGDACYVIADGEFEVSAKGRRLRKVTRGDVIGEVALLASISATATVTALTPGSVIRIGRGPFLIALTGYDVDRSSDGFDFTRARERFREVVAALQRDSQSDSTDRADAWLGVGAAGRMLADPTFTDVLARSAKMARAANDEVLLAEAAALTTWPGAFFFIAENPHQEMIDVCETALGTLRAEDPMRVRVLATLASNLTFASEPERRVELIREAHELARVHDDPALTGAVLNAEFICMWEPGTLERRQHIGQMLTDIGARTGDAELLYIGGFFEAYCAAEGGLLAEARQRLVTLREMLPATHNQYFEFLGERLILSIDIARCEPGVQERIDALAERHRQTHADTDGTWAVQVGSLAYQAGTLGSMVTVISTMLDGPHARTWRAALALAHLMAGDVEDAAATLAEQGDVPKSYFWLTVAQAQAEVAATLRLTDRCRELFNQLSPFRRQLGITASGSTCFGLVSRSLGELALALGRHDDALDLLAEAVADADACGMHFEAVVARRLLATTHQALGDVDAASTLIEEAFATAQARGFAHESLLLTHMRHG
ncbi:MAG TPA: MFS transporter [Ilumatobacteraceae bacterium]|nr:MFS transporter [Ilumatobacteraceae bacterium]